MRPVLLIDFGSTCTKLAAVDVEARRLLGTAQDLTTAGTDIREGLEKARRKLDESIGTKDYDATLACSSAAGGLRMVACGLVPELTAKAARLAAYGAGAKVIRTYSFQLTEDDKREIGDIAPDILLLTGGTDGGNSEVVIHNAAAIAGIKGHFPVVYAGNRNAKDACLRVLLQSDHPVQGAPNVMPTFGRMNEQPVQEVIRGIFLKSIVAGKGLSHYSRLLDDILMPTPSAVLRALTLLSEGTGEQKGLGDLVAVDLGGATTDIYSIASGEPTRPATVVSGLREPYVKRSVEGDIGMRFGAAGVLEAAGAAELSRMSGLDEVQLLRMLEELAENPGKMPVTPDERQLDFALATLALRTGLLRHAGSLVQAYTPAGPIYQQTGKDLCQVRLMVLTGGSLIYSGQAGKIARAAVAGRDPLALIPVNFSVMMDSDYLLSAMGLLAGLHPEAAFEILTHHIGKEQDHATCQ